MTTARFFFYVNGSDCKLSLQPGQTLHHYWHAQTDEGFDSEACTFSYDGERVTLESYRRGRDCDGLMEHGQTLVCPLDRLQARVVEDGQFRWPEWKEVDSSQRDHTAESMGY